MALAIPAILAACDGFGLGRRAALVVHVRDPVDPCLSHAIVARDLAECAALDATFGA